MTGITYALGESKPPQALSMSLPPLALGLTSDVGVLAHPVLLMP